MSEQLPPFSEPAERGVLGALLRWAAGWDNISGVLTQESFYLSKHRVIFAAMETCVVCNIPIDTVSVYNQIASAGNLEESGGAAYLAELWDATPTGANLEHYAKIVAEKALQRALIRVGTVIARDAQDGIGPPLDMLADAEAALAQLRLQGGRGELPATLDQAINEAVKRIDERAAKPNAGAITTGFEMLDKCLIGLFPGTLTCIAARPSVGKSAIAQSIAIHAAKQKHRVLFVTQEMSRLEIAERVLVNESGVHNYLVRTSNLSQSETLSLAKAAESLRGAGVRIDDEPGVTISRLASKCRVLKRREGLDLVIVDYLQIVRPDNPRLPRHEQVGAMSRSLKQLSQELQLPIVVLSQLNRDADNQNRQPRLSDIRESGAIEQDCDVVILLHRPSEERDHYGAEAIDLIVAKSRNAETGLIHLSYIGSRFRFVSDIPRI